ncbi:MAG: URC4/urg3 family protein [Rubrivivax sp.]|nr:URC4/urg3 family protein [Rubrivivax sp.]MDH5338408.1 URC4/urg3 family protein [Rubrivivax sp.]
MSEPTNFGTFTNFGTLGGVPADPDAVQTAVRNLRRPQVIRERCANLTAMVAAGQSQHFTLNHGRMSDVVKRVLRVTHERYPGPHVPYHSRWRHFEAAGVDRKAQLDLQMRDLSIEERARAYIDLAVVSVLLDAGAGDEWAYREAATGRRLLRSEGLAVATLRAFMAGRFSSDRRVPLRVDAQALERFDAAQLADVLQVSPDNPIVGLEGRVLLLQRLGKVLRKRADVFGQPGRPGRLFDLLGRALVGPPGEQQRLPVRRLGAPALLRTILKAFGAIWPSGQVLAGKPVGDCWPHPQAGGEGPDAGRVPFHKLSQWMAYSLVEPFQWAGIEVDGLDELTGLPEYRNGGLFIDVGVIVPRDRAFGTRIYTPADPWVIEWRAMTVTLLDEVARDLRVELGQPKLTLASVLEGGTWAAGREIAAELRPGGPPPVRVASNGTLF